MGYFSSVLYIVCLMLMILCSSSSVASVDDNDNVVGLIAGTKSGTYIHIANDIAKLAKASDIHVKVYESNGSLENVAAIFEREDIQLGLVQSDVLGYLQESQNRKLERVAQQIVMMLPLYDEQVHLLAKKSITNITDLNHKVVAVGNRGSGTNLTAELLLEIADVWPKKKYLIPDVEALQRLSNGELDALFYVSGYPISLLENVDSSRLHLVPISNDELLQYYVSSLIPEKTYPWQKSAVETVAVKAVLMTAGFHSEYCPVINQLMSLIREGKDKLKKTGHSKWKDINLDFVLNNWGVHGCFQF